MLVGPTAYVVLDAADEKAGRGAEIPLRGDADLLQASFPIAPTLVPDSDKRCISEAIAGKPSAEHACGGTALSDVIDNGNKRLASDDKQRATRLERATSSLEGWSAAPQALNRQVVATTQGRAAPEMTTLQLKIPLWNPSSWPSSRPGNICLPMLADASGPSWRKRPPENDGLSVQSAEVAALVESVRGRPLSRPNPGFSRFGGLVC